MDQKKTGYFIADIRKEKGLTQAELAEKLGVTNKTISRWETGFLVSALNSSNGLGRTVVVIAGFLMIFTGWYLRSKLDKKIFSGL